MSGADIEMHILIRALLLKSLSRPSNLSIVTWEQMHSRLFFNGYTALFTSSFLSPPCVSVCACFQDFGVFSLHSVPPNLYIQQSGPADTGPIRSLRHGVLPGQMGLYFHKSLSQVSLHSNTSRNIHASHPMHNSQTTRNSGTHL